MVPVSRPSSTGRTYGRSNTEANPVVSGTALVAVDVVVLSLSTGGAVRLAAAAGTQVVRGKVTNCLSSTNCTRMAASSGQPPFNASVGVLRGKTAGKGGQVQEKGSKKAQRT